MQIDIDFEVFKALTALRESEADSYNAVIRRMLGLPSQNALSTLLEKTPPNALAGGVNALASMPTSRPRRGMFGQAKHVNALASNIAIDDLLGRYSHGAWFSNVHFPEGTKFRATYKGQTYHAQIKDGKWLGEDGVARTSPSDAAGAISGTNVNGWRFWHAQLPDDPAWHRLDEFKA
jgi:hypothetical protein